MNELKNLRRSDLTLVRWPLLTAFCRCVWLGALCSAPLLLCARPAAAINLVWSGNGDGMTVSDASNWVEPSTSSTGVPGGSDTAWFGDSGTFEGDSSPGNTNLDLAIDLDGDRTIGSLQVASVPFADRNITTLAAQNVDLSFNNGGSAQALTVGSLNMAFSPRVSGSNVARLTVGNTAVDPSQTLNITGSAVVGSLRNADATLTVQEGGIMNLGSPGSRISATVGFQRSGIISQSLGRIEATGGTFAGHISSLVLGDNESTTTSSPSNLGSGTLDLTGIVLGSGGNVLDVNTAALASSTRNGDAQQALVNLGEGVARFGVMTLGRASGAAGAALTEAEVNLLGTVLQIDAGVTINGTSSINVTASGDEAGLDLGAGVPLAINDDGELNIVFEDTTLEIGEIFWGLRAVGDRVAELEGLAGLTLTDNRTFPRGTSPSIFFQDGFTFVGLQVVPEPSSSCLACLGLIMLQRRRRRRSASSRHRAGAGEKGCSSG